MIIVAFVVFAYFAGLITGSHLMLSIVLERVKRACKGQEYISMEYLIKKICGFV